MKFITKTDILNNIKIDSNLVDSNFIKLYSLYNSLITIMLFKYTDIYLVDKKVYDSDLNFTFVDENDMDCYQYLSSPYLKYFYLRNNIHIERLDNNEKEYLLDLLKNPKIELTDEIEKFLIGNMNKVLPEKENSKKLDICYGPDSDSFLAPANNIIIGFRYNEFNNGIEDENEWNDNNIKQKAYKKEILNELKESFSNFTYMDISVIEYNEFSISKRNI